MRQIDADKYGKEMKDYFINLIQQGKHEVDVVDCNADLRKIMDGQATVNGWIPCSERYPKTGEDKTDNILLSFTNFPIPLVGRWEEDEEGGAFYAEHDTKSCVSKGLIVNAWMPLPKRYKEMAEDEEENADEEHVS